MALAFTKDDKDTLVTIVKVAQRLDVQGSSGGWKEFLAAKGVSSSLRDPDKQKLKILAEFVQSLASDGDHDLSKRLRSWSKWRASLALADANDPWPKTPEQCLVDLTIGHPRFSSLYTFPSFLEGWKCTKRGPSSAASNPERLLSLDCEMVMCEGNEQQVVQVCVVDRNLETVLNTLVKPNKKVIDYITHIHGITKEDLRKATCTQEEIQREVLKLLKPGTILVGHSVFNDLKVLRIDHRRIIDTAMVLSFPGVQNTAMVGLDRYCQAILGYNFRENGQHNCLDDAIVPMKLVLHELQNKSSKPLEIASPGNRLLIHNISHKLSHGDLRSMLSSTIPCTIEKVPGRKQQFHAVFESRELADRVFEELSGEADQDSLGFEQKPVARWRNAQFVQLRVRKLVHSDEMQVPDRELKLPAKREREDAVAAKDPKRLKPTSVCSCGKAEELERLTKKLAASNAEIASLKKLIANFQR